MTEPLCLIVRSEPLDPATMDEYHSWYAQHVSDLLDVPGVLSGRRFECIDGEPRFMAMYSIADFDVFSTPAYRRVQGFGQLTNRLRFTRNVYREMPIGGPSR